MNPIQTIIQKLDPIPPQYHYLATEFQAQGREFLQRWIIPGTLLGGLMTTGYVFLPYIIYQETASLVLPLYIGIVLCYMVIASLFYWGGEKVPVDGTIFGGWSVITLLSLIVMRITNDYSSASGILIITVMAYAGLLPWPAKYTIWLYIEIIVGYLLLSLTLTAQDNWIDYTITGILLLIIIFIFGAAYGLVVRLRWKNFLNERLVQKANIQLKTLNERLQRELVLAHDIQRSLLPAADPDWPDIDAICYTISAREVGGDFYNYHIFDSNPESLHYALTVGDVSGKGMAAALLMAINLANFNSMLEEPFPPDQRLIKLDQAMVPYTKATSHNCALCYVELRASAMPKTFSMSIVNAGCIPPYVKRKDGSVEWLETGGLPLGVGLSKQMGYPILEATVSTGDIIVMTSDGVVEANTSNEDMFGFDRLQAAIEKGPRNNAQAMLDHLKQEIADFVGEAEPHDDLTIVVLKV